MPHKVNIDSIYENIFLLVNVCYGAKAFARSHNLSYENDEDLFGGHYYYGWLQAVVSDKLIDTAIKSRIIFDIIIKNQIELEEDGSESDWRLSEVDKRICRQYNIGYTLESRADVSIREACNKIIHADDINYFS